MRYPYQTLHLSLELALFITWVEQYYIITSPDVYFTNSPSCGYPCKRRCQPCIGISLFQHQLQERLFRSCQTFELPPVLSWPWSRIYIAFRLSPDQGNVLKFLSPYQISQACFKIVRTLRISRRWLRFLTEVYLIALSQSHSAPSSSACWVCVMSIVLISRWG